MSRVTIITSICWVVLTTLVLVIVGITRPGVPVAFILGLTAGVISVGLGVMLRRDR